MKCTEDKWCLLNSVDLQNSHFENLEGVYIIWHGGIQPQTVRVGQGIIRDRLSAHRKDTQVQAYSHLGLFVTWAPVEKSYRDGVEAFLTKWLDPKVGEVFPGQKAIEVNLPW